MSPDLWNIFFAICCDHTSNFCCYCNMLSGVVLENNLSRDTGYDSFDSHISIWLVTKFWTFQVRKSHSCGISAIFFWCCFMIETQVLMTVADFLRLFSRSHFLEGVFTFQWGDWFFRWGALFLSVGGGGQHPMGSGAAGFWWWGFKKKL